MNIEYEFEISIQEYEKLREAVGWAPLERSQATAGIKNSLKIAVAKDKDKAVGMARLIGDGGHLNIIADVIVLPEYQGLGIGKNVVKSLLNHIKENLSVGQSAMVYVMSAAGKESFYESLGFERRPNKTLGCGMTQQIKV